MQSKQNRPSFTKSTLLSKLEAFLPVMAAENLKLNEAMAAGKGAKHNIEMEEAEEQVGYESDDFLMESDTEEKQQKKIKLPVIEMNFALGTMDEDDVDAEDTDEAVDSEAQIKAMAAKEVFDVSSGFKQHRNEISSLRLQLTKPSNKPCTIIQELD